MKKKGVQSPAKITLKEGSQSPRMGPQEIIMSDHSLKNDNGGGGQDWQRNKSPLAEKEQSTRTKAKSPQEKAMELAKAWSSTKTVKPNLGKGPSEGAQKDSKDTRQTKPSMDQPWQGEKQAIPPGKQGGRKQSWQDDGGDMKEGEQVFPNGDTYIGTWKDKWIEGYGVYTFTKLNLQYRGQFKKSKQHGTGVLLRKPTGPQKEEEIYDGEWMNGEKHGLGKYYYFKDTFYDGDWYKNKKEGHGKFKSPEGEYTGQWKNDKKNGKGKLTLKNGHTFDGRWVEDEFVEGVLVHSNGDKYDGEFENFARHGFGTYTYTNKTTYRGNWANNEKNGQGEIKYYNGDAYHGGMVGDRREGTECHYSWASGEQVLGEFVGDLPSKGKVRLPAEGESEFNIAR